MRAAAQGHSVVYPGPAGAAAITAMLPSTALWMSPILGATLVAIGLLRRLLRKLG